ncbi:AI-2E family transporter [Planctomicrobium sp. SH527]|uniref:AI-2E family transporter n=1 Tax=Planctomicrobium sp. SH527 TaxID=3448123 RepID=UPI003F5C090F
MDKMPRLVSLGALLLSIIILGITFFKVLAPFLMPMFLAAMTAVICQPVFRYFLAKMPQNVPLAAGITTGALLAAFLVPLTVVTTLASLQLYAFAADADEKSLRRVAEYGVEIVNRFRPEDEQLTVAEAASYMSGWMKNSLTSIGDKSLGAAGTTLGALSGFAGYIAAMTIGMIVYGMALYYFLSDGPNLLRISKEMIPVDLSHQNSLLMEFSKVVQGVVVATFLAAVGQGIATTAALAFLGFPHLFALGALATFAALIPVAGTPIIWIPCAIWLFMHGRVAECIGLVLYCSLFVGFLDNVIRTYVLNSNVKLHPLLAFISVLGGIQALGLWGVFIGPIIACCLYALIKIFNVELADLAKSRQAPAPVLDIAEGVSAALSVVVPSVVESEESDSQPG